VVLAEEVVLAVEEVAREAILHVAEPDLVDQIQPQQVEIHPQRVGTYPPRR